MTLFAVIRLRGRVGVREEIERTLRLLHLHRKFTCSLINPNPSLMGMIRKVQDYVTFGEIDKETLKLLILKRGRLPGNKRISEEYIKQKLGMDLDTFCDKLLSGEMKLTDLPGIKPFFRLMPPRGGLERKGIKAPYSMGGALGYRGKAINDLLRRMI